jgi:hypothetical protein
VTRVRSRYGKGRKMGGFGSGKTRRQPGTGRKPKDPVLRALDGNAGRRPVAPPVPALTPRRPVRMPATLRPDERKVWRQLAPHAKALGTLTPGTALGFEWLCRHVVLLTALWADVETRGTPKYLGVVQKVEAGLIRFALAPYGKPMPDALAPAPAAPVNPLDRFLKKAATG